MTEVKKKFDIIFYGMVVIDYLFVLDHYPRRGQIQMARENLMKLGGSATNSAICASLIGAKVGLAGCHYLGQDFAGEYFRQNILNYKNIDTQHIFQCQTQSTHGAYIWIDETGERTIISQASPKKYISLDEEYLKKAKLLSVDGRFGKSDPYMLEAAQLANKLNIPVIVTDIHLRKPIFKHADFVIVSQHLRKNESVKDRQKHIAQKYTRYGKTMIFTLGADGCILLQQGKCSYFPVEQKVKVVDTTGAGDTFRAGFAYGITKQWSIEKCVRFAVFAGTRACTYMGGSPEQQIDWKSKFIQCYGK